MPGSEVLAAKPNLSDLTLEFSFSDPTNIGAMSSITFRSIYFLIKILVSVRAIPAITDGVPAVVLKVPSV